MIAVGTVDSTSSGPAPCVQRWLFPITVRLAIRLCKRDYMALVGSGDLGLAYPTQCTPRKGHRRIGRHAPLYFFAHEAQPAAKPERYFRQWRQSFHCPGAGS